jgi:hypothetical protein
MSVILTENHGRDHNIIHHHRHLLFIAICIVIAVLMLAGDFLQKIKQVPDQQLVQSKATEELCF